MRARLKTMLPFPRTRRARNGDYGSLVAAGGPAGSSPSASGGRGAFRTSAWPRRIAIVCGLAAAVSVTAFVALNIAVARMGPPDLAEVRNNSHVVLDREGRLLRPFTTADGRWRLPVTVDDVDQRYLAMLMAFEDKRFYRHPGVDARSMMRAAWQLARYRRIISGGSTLTMQVARLIEGRHERSAGAKLQQIMHALQLERHRSKREILTLYLRLAPFGGNIEGVRAASLAYFGKEPKRLSIGQAALLVALPQSPEVRRPDRNAAAARIARNRVLERAAGAGVITRAEADRARLEPVPNARLAFPMLAPHLAEAEVAAEPGNPVHRLTIDRDVQRSLETLAGEQTKLLGQRLSAAILAVDNKTGEVIAHVGSAAYLDDDRFGAIDMTNAVRSPGSTLKPFIYGLSFEAGLAHPETLIEDRAVRFGSYAPKNFDEGYHGTVTIREALAQSLNIPAVKVLAAVGPGKLAGRFRRIGVIPAFPDGTAPTLATALGGVGLTLHDLATLYASLAGGGKAVALHHRLDAGKPDPFRDLLHGKQLPAPKRVLTAVAAWYVTDILKDAPPPLNAKAGRLAYKTGTSYGYRDAWAVGYDGHYTVAVWVGRPDGASTPGLVGRIAAAPILFDAFARISDQRTRLPKAPDGVVRATGAELPPPLKRFREGGEELASGPFLEPRVLISFPPDRAEVETEADEAVQFKASGGVLPLTWLINGSPIRSDPRARNVTWQPGGPGFVKLSVIDAKGRVDRVTVRMR
jgi:penicillin-binding protein 1C